MLDNAEKAGDLPIALGAIREPTGTLELLAKLLGELEDHSQVNFLVSREWLELRAMVVITAQEPYPEARGAVLKGLESAGNCGLGRFREPLATQFGRLEW
jgi:hypothetical protein